MDCAGRFTAIAQKIANAAGAFDARIISSPF
jgi:hypothetical protein